MADEALLTDLAPPPWCCLRLPTTHPRPLQRRLSDSNSKLTFLLQDSLGGNSKVFMFVNISPAAYNSGETICSLNFAGRCRNVQLGQQAHKKGGGGADEAGRLREQLLQLQEELAAVKAGGGSGTTTPRASKGMGGAGRTPPTGSTGSTPR